MPTLQQMFSKLLWSSYHQRASGKIEEQRQKNRSSLRKWQEAEAGGGGRLETPAAVATGAKGEAGTVANMGAWRPHVNSAQATYRSWAASWIALFCETSAIQNSYQNNCSTQMYHCLGESKEMSSSDCTKSEY